MSRGLSKKESTRTAIFAVAVLSLFLVIWLISANIRTDRPVTLDGVSAEVMVGVSEFQDDLPKSAVVDVVDQKDVEACPDGSGGKQMVISRTITTAPTFDRLHWLSDLGSQYEKKGWHSSTQTLGSRDHARHPQATNRATPTPSPVTTRNADDRAFVRVARATPTA